MEVDGLLTLPKAHCGAQLVDDLDRVTACDALVQPENKDGLGALLKVGESGTAQDIEFKPLVGDKDIDECAVSARG